MNHLIVYAHPSTKSFCRALMLRMAASYRLQGGDVIVSDLYAMSFNPVLSEVDLAINGWEPYGSEVRTEQDKIRWADTITFIAPVWWNGLPAILKGYFDRIFRDGFAYSYINGKIEGLLTDKRFLLVCTTGENEATFRAWGIMDAMTQIMENGLFHFCGAMQSEVRFFCGIPNLTESERKLVLDEAGMLARSFAREEEQHYYF